MINKKISNDNEYISNGSDHNMLLSLKLKAALSYEEI